MAQMQASNHPHIFFIDLDDNGILQECAVLKTFPNGDLSYIPISGLDTIDKGRLLKIVKGQHADKFELFELMKGTTLLNGMNALTYFHQLTKVLTTSGQTMLPDPTKRGAGIQRVKPPAAKAQEPTTTAPKLKRKQV